MQTLRPPRLRPGDAVGIVAPGSPPSSPLKIERGAAYIASKGFRPVIGTHAFDADGYLAGSDAGRAADINAMFSDAAVRAIVAVRGGYGSPRILDLIDYDAVRRDPKIFVGYSDCTALQCALFARAGLVSFSGPMVAVEMERAIDPFTERNFWPLLTDPSAGRRIPDDGSQSWSVLRTGSCEGTLIGGNCTLLSSLSGTPYFPPTDGAVLFLEEVGEKPYRIDRMLAQLRLAGVLGRIGGVCLGSFSDCDPGAGEQSLTLERVFGDYLPAVAGPVVGGLPYGHRASMMTIPFGVRARLDADRRFLELLESPVS